MLCESKAHFCIKTSLCYEIYIAHISYWEANFCFIVFFFFVDRFINFISMRLYLYIEFVSQTKIALAINDHLFMQWALNMNRLRTWFDAFEMSSLEMHNPHAHIYIPNGYCSNTHFLFMFENCSNHVPWGSVASIWFVQLLCPYKLRWR